MSSKIQFQIIESGSTFLDPRKNFQKVVEYFQVRIDPLTGRTGHLSHFGAIKFQKLPLDAYAAPEIKGFCPFCPENREKFTPKFTEEIAAEGRLTKNSACLIPNLFPYDVRSTIMIMCDEHMVPINRLDETMLKDSFSLGIHFLKKIKSIDPSLPYHLMTWNYMPPSGGGLVHPHQQYFSTAFPGNQFMDELKASEIFYRTQGQNYWPTLIKEEAEIGERYIGATGSSHWLTSFVSLGLLGEILCIFPDVFSINDFTEEHIAQLVSGLLKIFQYYESQNIYSFNTSLFFGPDNQKFFSCYFRIAPRTFLNLRDYAPDANFFQVILSEPVSVVLPEELCRNVRKYF
ncbi:MAG TPA: hypothetical protein DDW17_07610 [Deltaproteobacteria bacterium]|nr:hypothetical protein [Deltaproteobacteria bacterium]